MRRSARANDELVASVRVDLDDGRWVEGAVEMARGEGGAYYPVRVMSSPMLAGLYHARGALEDQAFSSVLDAIGREVREVQAPREEDDAPYALQTPMLPPSLRVDIAAGEG